MGSSMLALVVDLAPGVSVVSQRFSVYARRSCRRTQSPAPSSSSCNSLSSSTAVVACDRTPTLQELLSPLGDCSRLSSMMAVGMALSVRLYSVMYTPEEQQIIASSLVHVLHAKVPGFVLHKTGLIANIEVVVIGCNTASSLVEAWENEYLYITNTIRNPMNRNLLEGVIQPIAHVTNLR
eukprot:m51a1_g9380 hypothetical protein (180) ;mRNA; f:215096-215686